jgi:hypothetical protein
MVTLRVNSALSLQALTGGPYRVGDPSVPAKPFSSLHDTILKHTTATIRLDQRGSKKGFAPCGKQRTADRLKFGWPLNIVGLKISPSGLAAFPSNEMRNHERSRL